ncbi:uncharacterized protein CIMG_05810 [Coccidioides immitis RS]|uniref:Uncharacterized protein n=1 Tax=Coccidioides immitis (strain RS) TaxID=246410 RepID=A0A0E1S1J5_COCIM|nr:uncharacterized protein CIMG_05810 [Coccidioides immitis RS]EAS30331.2 hypothetical protein CIMG_05810 [Coccidioides immitis RS]
MDVLAALDSLSTLDAIISDSRYESGSVSDNEDDNNSQLPAEHYLALAESLDIAQLRQKRYCQHIKANVERQWDQISDSEETVHFLYVFFSWWCDICCGKNNQYCPGIKCKSLLETFWKWWHLVLKQETASGLNKDTIVKVEDVVAQVATEKKLALVGWPKKNMYIEDVAEFTQVILTTTEMTFVSDGGRPQLFIFLKPEFTKRFLEDKALNKFKILEIIFDLTLVLSPHICLLTMLFHIGGFKSISTTGPVLDSAEKLYSIKVLDGKGQQPLLLKNELLDKFVFCQMELTFTGFKICLDQRMTASMITGFEKVAHLYNLHYAGAEAFNNSEEVMEVLQNIMLQHADICTFVKHYQVDVDVDAQGIVRKTGSQTAFLSAEESRSLNYLPVVLGWQDTVQKCKQELKNHEAELECANEVCKSALGHLDNRALAESNPDVLVRLEVFRDQTAEAKLVYNSTVCTSLEAEYQWRINTINAGVAFCGVEEGQPSCWPACWPVVDDPYPLIKWQRCLVKDNTEVLLHQAMESVQAKPTAEQPQACF